MTASGTQVVRRTSIRVALVATAVVAVAYLAVAFAVALIFTRDQTSQIDQRLVASLQRPHFDDHGGAFGPPESDHPGGLPVLAWLILPDGSVQKDSMNPFDLPSQYQKAGAPQDATIAGTNLRVAGTAVHIVGTSSGDGYFVVGQSLGPLDQARSTVVLAEVLIAPVLLAIVFLGAVMIGRRVATPIELARQRQLEFTADASHELRTPLSVIEAHTSLALTHERDADWYRTAFEHVDDESKRMRRLLDDLLWLARFDATQGVPNAEPVDVGVLAVQTADRFGAIAEIRRLQARSRGRQREPRRHGPARMAGPAPWRAARQRLQVLARRRLSPGQRVNGRRSGAAHRRRRRAGHPGRRAVAHLRSLPPRQRSQGRRRAGSRDRRRHRPGDQWPLADRRLAGRRGEHVRQLAPRVQRPARDRDAPPDGHARGLQVVDSAAAQARRNAYPAA